MQPQVIGFNAKVYRDIAVLSEKISKTMVLSLPEDAERREHVRKHFLSVGIEKYEFVKAVEAGSEKVKSFYRKGLVKKYPGCFRCGATDCACENNILVPSQIANWASFLKIWKLASKESGLYLICEDDVFFYKNAVEVLNSALDKTSCDRGRLLLRLVESGRDPIKILDANVAPHLTERVVMSNAAYVLNSNMAAYLLDTFEGIATTSDVWLHGRVALHESVQALTIDPLIGTELSFNKEYAVFRSQIHPKGIDAIDLTREADHIKRVTNKAEYDALFSIWAGQGSDQDGRS